MQAECDEFVAAEKTRAASLEQELEAARSKMDVLKKALEDRRKDIADLRCVHTTTQCTMLVYTVLMRLHGLEGSINVSIVCCIGSQMLDTVSPQNTFIHTQIHKQTERS